MKIKTLVAVAAIWTTCNGQAITKAEWESGRRDATLTWFRDNFYGRAPDRPADETFDDEGVSFAKGEFKIRVHRTLPAGASAANPAPVFLLLDHYLGTEEKDGRWTSPDTPTNTITGRGYAYLNINLNDIALNCYDARWSNKVHRVYGASKPNQWGTLSAWAWGVSRVMDWIERQPELDAKRVAVVGHSRGGKAALWAAAQDERIAMAVPNGSGTGGARLLDTELVDAEPLDWMLGHRALKTWFCGNLRKYALADRNMQPIRNLPYDADDLIRLVCPRLVYVASGSEDSWAGPQGEFEAARRASDLWRAYGLKGLGLTAYPRPDSWDHAGRVGYSLRKGPHALAPWNWERLLDFADLHLKRNATGGANEPRCAAGDAPGLYGRPVRLEQRVDPVTARSYGEKPNIALKGWRGERIHAQVVVWSDTDQGKLATTATDFVGPNGAKIGANRVTARFVRTAQAPYAFGGKKKHWMADCLDPTANVWPKENFRAVWFTVDVPADTTAGTYTGLCTVKGASGGVPFPVTLTVGPHQLPAVKDRKFFLDLWQHPWAVAKRYHVKPFSPEHYARMEPIYRELAAGGQKVITTSITDLPWGEGYAFDRGEIRTMVDYYHRADGTYRADFTNFDAFVAFAKKCGLGPQIHLYTIIKFNNKHIFYFTEEATGERRAEELYEGTKEYEAFLTPLLTQLQTHLVEKGWINDARIAVDEVAPERLPAVITFLHRVAPQLKFALASTVDPMRFAAFEKDVDVFSQILWTGHGITNLFTSAFDDGFLASRRKAGRVTTFYVCTAPAQPNTWFQSPLVEASWIGLYAAAKGYDGFLRWAAFLWGEDPFNHPEGEGYPTGEDFLIYPEGLASVRWEFLKDSIENWEKIRILRETGEATPALENALKHLNYPFIGHGDADLYSLGKRVNAVLDQL